MMASCVSRFVNSSCDPSFVVLLKNTSHNLLNPPSSPKPGQGFPNLNLYATDVDQGLGHRAQNPLKGMGYPDYM